MVRISSLIIFAAFIAMNGLLSAQGTPGFQPQSVANQQDEGTLTKKASRLVGFNLIRSVLQQGGKPDLKEVEMGMRSAKAEEDQSGFIAGYNVGMQLKSRNSEFDMDKVLAGIKAAKDGVDKKSFISGFQLMENMVSTQADLEIDSILEGMNAALSGNDLGMSPEESQAVMNAFGKIVQERQVAKMKSLSDENMAKTRAYMAKNKADNPGVKELSNGVQYLVIEEGSGESPTAEDRVKVDYHGTFIDGTVFDSTTKPPGGLPPEPATFLVGEVVPGFRSALTSMKVGDKWKIVIPGKLAYGAQGRGKIGPNQALLFEIKLLAVIPKK